MEGAIEHTVRSSPDSNPSIGSSVPVSRLILSKRAQAGNARPRRARSAEDDGERRPVPGALHRSFPCSSLLSTVPMPLLIFSHAQKLLDARASC